MLALEITLCLLDVSQRGLRRAQRRDAVTVAMAAETFSFFPQARVCLKLVLRGRHHSEPRAFKGSVKTNKHKANTTLTALRLLRTTARWTGAPWDIHVVADSDWLTHTRPLPCVAGWDSFLETTQGD